MDTSAVRGLCIIDLGRLAVVALKCVHGLMCVVPMLSGLREELETCFKVLRYYMCRGRGKDTTRKRKREEEKRKLDSWKSDILYLIGRRVFFARRVTY